jgi:translation initiation factor 3 subunit F
LLGSKDGNVINISTSFAVPFVEGKDSEVFETDFLAKMLKFHRKVSQKEGLIGLYYTSNNVSQSVLTLFSHYMTLFKEKKNKPVGNQPLLMLVDPTMQDNRMSIKMMNIVYSQPINFFAECPFKFQVKDFEKTGLDLIFFG